jgi:hypothetical protein
VAARGRNHKHTGDAAVAFKKTLDGEHPRTGLPAGSGVPKTWFWCALFLIGASAPLILGACANRSTISLEGKPISG